ncbi:MAG: AAA family ATPase [Gemmatimonadaceae bacterium]
MSSLKLLLADDGAAAPSPGPTLHVLGRLELVAADGTVLLGPGKPLALLTYLRAQSMHSATRPHLVDLLWSDLEPERARANVRQALLVLRRLLPGDTIVSDGDQVVLRGELAFDRDAFVAAVDRNDLSAAIALYRGDFIPDLAVPGGAEFELWCDIERRHLCALFSRVLETAARAELAAGRSAVALGHARRLRDLDPSRERSWRLLIEAEIAALGVASARLEADRLAEQLRAENRPPEPATAQLFQRVREVARPALASGGPLTAPEFVGRETQLSRVLMAWGTVKRGRLQHLHVEALAGTGKTRLLEESCARLQAAGARVVRVGARRDERDVPFALAASLVTVLARLPGGIAVAPGSMAALVAMAPDASAVFAAHADPSTGDEAMRRRAVALADLVGAVANETSVTIAIDDTHWADRASLNILALAMGRVSDDTRVLLLTAGREALPGDTSAERVSLPPLTAPQVDAMLQSIGGAGDASWWATFIAALCDAARGVPFQVLQLLHAVVEKQLLVIEGDAWSAPNVPALLAALDARESARLRIAQLSVSARAALRVLCYGTVPDGGVVAAAVASEPDLVAADLAMLEVRGYARRTGDGGWAVAHDEIGELVLAQSDAASLRAAQRGLALALAATSAVTVAEMRRIVSLLVEAEADAEVEGVVRGWVRSGGCPPTGVLASDLLPVGVPAERLTQMARPIRRALPRARRSHRGHVLALASVVLLAVLAWHLTRPASLVFIQTPIATNHLEVTDRAPILGVEDRLGRRLQVSGVLVRVRGTLIPGPSGQLSAVTRDGIARFDSLVPGGDPSTLGTLRFEAAGLSSAIWTPLSINSPRLRVRSGVINGQPLRGDLPLLRVSPGARIEGQVQFTYHTAWSSATVFLGEAATWERRETDTASVRSLVTPLEEGVVQATVGRVAPLRPGRYFLVWAMGAETRAAFLFSQTNWTCGNPIWRDGNDLQDLPLDSLRVIARQGTYSGVGVRCHEFQESTAPHAAPTAMGIAAVELIVATR